MAVRNKSYLTKTIRYAGKEVSLYSIDGLVWSTRKEELEQILERHQNERASFGDQIVGGPQSRAASARAKAAVPAPAPAADKVVKPAPKAPKAGANKVAAKTQAKKTAKAVTGSKGKAAKGIAKQRDSGKPGAKKAKSKRAAA